MELIYFGLCPAADRTGSRLVWLGFGRAICTRSHSGETPSCSLLCSCCLPATFVEVSTPATDPFSAPPVAWMITGINNRLMQCQHGPFLFQFMLAQRQLGINSVRKYLDEAAHGNIVLYCKHEGTFPWDWEVTSQPSGLIV